MSYYEKNFWQSVRTRWDKAKAEIVDPVAIGIGNEIASKDRPTPNQFGTLMNILENAPRDEPSANF